MAEISQEIIESLARHFLPQIKEFFESEEGQKEYEEWKEKKAAKKSEENNKP